MKTIRLFPLLATLVGTTFARFCAGDPPYDFYKCHDGVSCCQCGVEGCLNDHVGGCSPFPALYVTETVYTDVSTSYLTTGTQLYAASTAVVDRTSTLATTVTVQTAVTQVQTVTSQVTVGARGAMELDMLFGKRQDAECQTQAPTSTRTSVRPTVAVVYTVLSEAFVSTISSVVGVPNPLTVVQTSVVQETVGVEVTRTSTSAAAVTTQQQPATVTVVGGGGGTSSSGSPVAGAASTTGILRSSSTSGSGQAPAAAVTTVTRSGGRVMGPDNIVGLLLWVLTFLL